MRLSLSSAWVASIPVVWQQSLDVGMSHWKRESAGDQRAGAYRSVRPEGCRRSGWASQCQRSPGCVAARGQQSLPPLLAGHP